MRNRAGRKLASACAALACLFLAGNAQAVSLGKIAVSSFLGEQFYAEIPLQLDADESIGKLSVEIASITEYRIFEVYRDQILQSIRADIVADNRSARIKLSSGNRLNAPFFNLVLKIRYGRVTHFKKFPVLLEQPRVIQKLAEKKRLPSVKAIRPAAATQPPLADQQSAANVREPAAAAVKRFDGWARTGRYGPIVRGDSLSTVAMRLRIDRRYSLNQVMAAMFEKNRNKFDQNNMNLLKAGSFLDVPTAAEVERLSKRQAHAVLADHEKRWKQLTRQPRYAAEKLAQQTRYSKRILIGKRADGVASAPAMTQLAKTTVKSEAVSEISSTEAEPADPAQETGLSATGKSADAQILQAAGEESASSALIAHLKKQNADLRKQVREKERLFNRSVEAAAVVAKKASTAAIAKLEVLVSQLQSQLEEVRKTAESKHSQGPEWIIWLLSGLVAVLLAIVGLLLRREPTHPAIKAVNQQTKTKAAKVASGDKPTPETGEQADADAGGNNASFNATTPDDELTETHTTAEKETEAADSSVDYLSEADVYIRYGMVEEALQQLNMALDLQADNVEAHIKKAGVLSGDNDSKRFEEAVAAAGSVLTGAALERFTSAVAELEISGLPAVGDRFEHGVVGDNDALAGQTDTVGQPRPAMDDSEIKLEDAIDMDAIDFNIPDLQLDQADIGQQSEAGELAEAVAGPDSGATQELDYILDESASEVEQIIPDHIELVEDTDIHADNADTLELDQLLSEFSDDDEDEKKDK